MSVGSAALIVGILTSFFDGKDSVGTLIRMISGLFLALIVLKPVTGLCFDNIESFVQSYSVTGQTIAASGQNLALEASKSYIKERTEAYILDMAESYGATLSVEVTLGSGENPVPESVSIHGNISPYGKKQLQKVLAEELGIPKEQQIWTG